MLSLLLAVMLGSLDALAAPSSPLFDNSRDPLPNADFMRLSKAGYKFTPEGRVLKPESLEPLESAEMPQVLEELESRQRLEAMLRLNLIFSRFGYKDLPDDQLEELRRIGRQNWMLLGPSLRADLKGYFEGAELEALNKGVSLIRTPRTWLPDDLGQPRPEAAADEPVAPLPEDLPPTGRPLSVADTMPVKALPAPWGKSEPAPVVHPAPGAAGSGEPFRAPPPPPPPPPPTPAPVVAAAPPAAIIAPVKPTVPVTATGEGIPAIIVPPGGPAPSKEAIAALESLIRTGMAPPPSPGAQTTVTRTPTPAAVTHPPPVETKPQPVPVAPPPPAPGAAGSGEPFRAPVPAATARLMAFAEYPVFASDTFAKFLAEAPYGREAHHLLELIARHGEPEDRRIALGVVSRHLPAMLLDPAKAGTSMRAALILPQGEVGVAKSIIVLHTGPVLARRKRLLMGSQQALVPDSKDFYQERALAAPALGATALGAASAKEEEGDWGRALVFDDGSRRLRPSPEQLAGTLVEQLLLIDAKARGWEDAYHSRLRARSAQLRFYRRLAGETSTAPRLDRALAAEYSEWLHRPLDWNDHWVQALSAPVESVVAPSVSGDLEERLRARGAAELAVLEKIGLAPERTTPAPTPKPDEYVEREHQARIDRELKALSTTGVEARAWITAEHAFRRDLSAATH